MVACFNKDLHDLAVGGGGDVVGQSALYLAAGFDFLQHVGALQFGIGLDLGVSCRVDSAAVVEVEAGTDNKCCNDDEHYGFFLLQNFHGIVSFLIFNIPLLSADISLSAGADRQWLSAWQSGLPYMHLLQICIRFWK